MKWIVGVCVTVGALTVAIGINEMFSVTGYNVVREWIGMSQEDYNTLYLCLNIASTVCTIVGSLARSWKGSNCFIAGTLIACLDENGKEVYKPIEEIRIGDKVLAYDEKTGEQAYKEVVRLFRNETKEWYHIHANGEEIICTGGHPFYVKDEGFVCAKDLKISDKLLLSDGTCAIIKEIQVEQLSTLETTYNFEVADFHTYYVSNSKILVHNTCPDPNDKVSDILKTRKGSIKNAPKPKGAPSWDEISDMTFGEVTRRAKKGEVGYREIRKLLLDGRFKKSR